MPQKWPGPRAKEKIPREIETRKLGDYEPGLRVPSQQSLVAGIVAFFLRFQVYFLCFEIHKNMALAL